MKDQPVLLSDIVGFLGKEFAVDRYPEGEQGGLYHPPERPVRRLGLALEPFPDLARWTIRNQLDALWLHRPWQLDPATLPPGVGVIYNHLPFDEHLTMGYNARLAARLQAIGPPEPLGFKQANSETGETLPQRPIGMIVDAGQQRIQDRIDHTEAIFGGYDRLETGRETGSGRIAVVGAMNDALVREAADRGAELYLTGQYRSSAQDAVNETGITVVAVGHRRSEEWGLRALADLVSGQWKGIDVMVGQ